MRFEHNFSPPVLTYNFTFEASDRKEYVTIERKHVTKSADRCVYILPEAVRNIPDDHIVLTALLSIFSFIGKSLTCSCSVSTELAEAIEKNLGIRVNGTGTCGSVPNLGADGRPALCLSMGVDSCAGLALMPDNTVCVFSDRIFPKNSRKNLYNKDHVYNGLQRVKEKNRDVYVVRTDMENLRTPVGFVLDIGVGAPAVLLSSHLGIRSVAYGYSIHNFEHYGEGRLLYTCTGDYCKFNYTPWSNVFQAAGLTLNFITAGLTEIGTAIVSLKSEYAELASGCMRGTMEGPCMKCRKCYRKLILEDIIKWGRIDDPRGNYSTLSKTEEHRLDNIFAEFSSGLIMAYAFAVGNKPTHPSDRFLATVQAKLTRENPLNWKSKIKYINKWFTGAFDRIDPLCKDHLIERLTHFGIALAD